MSLPFYACPSCHKDFRAEVASPDQNVRCPHCKQIVHVPKKSAAKWFLARGKDKIGPLTLNQLQEYADKGELQRDTMLLKDGDGTWVRAGDFPLLFPEASAVHTAPAPRYSRRFMIVIASLVSVLLVGGGWIVFSKQRFPSGGPFVKNDDQPKNDVKKEIGDPPPKKVEDPPPDIADVVKDAFRKIEAYRKAAGAPPASFNLELSEACEAHAKYVARNPDLPTDKLDEEDPNQPGYSPKGKEAARWSFIFLKDPLAKIDSAMANTIMRTALINPRLEKIGIGYAKSDVHGDILVIDAKRGEGDTVVVYPGPDQTNVPVYGVLKRFQRDDRLVSFPITIQFPSHYEISDLQASVTPNEWGKLLHHEDQGNMIVLYRERPLPPGTKHTVRIQAVVNDKIWRKEWQFTTGVGQAAQAGNTANDVLAKINHYRKLAGLGAVSIDPRSSRGCGKHARYLISNAGRPEVQGERARTESPFLNGATQEGHDAAQRSNIMLGDVTPVKAVDAWMASFFHRNGLLNPQLHTVGIGIDRSNDRKTWATVVDVKRGRRVKLQFGPAIYPRDGQRDVPLAMHEHSDVIRSIPFAAKYPVGNPITVRFAGNFRPVPELVRLTDADGKPVEYWLSHPGRPANIQFREFQERTICLIPKQPLQPKTKYTVHIRAKRLKNWEKTWSFETAAQTKSEPAQTGDPALQMLAEINRYRRSAKLRPVTLAPRYSKGCQAHADYLQANIAAGGLGTKDLSREYPAKLKFSKEGQKAGSRALIRIRLPSTKAMIDELIRTPKLRPFLLDPQWRYAGIGCAYDPARGWITVLDVLGDREFFVRYPGDGATGVPRVGRSINPESFVFQLPGLTGKPSSAGFPITVTFLQNVTHPRIKLERQGFLGWESVRYYDVEQTIPNTVKIIPVDALARRSVYRVTLTVFFGDWDWALGNWQFRTGD